MNKLLDYLLGATLVIGTALPAIGHGHPDHIKDYQPGQPGINQPIQNLTEQIPLIDSHNEIWEKTLDVAQWGDGDWSQVIGRAQNVTVKEAMEIAESLPEVTYFFYLKGGQMVLGKKPNLRIFKHGDAVFFAGKPQWGEAKGLADGYMKKNLINE